jgi:dihydroxyacetone kinase-like protein
MEKLTLNDFRKIINNVNMTLQENKMFLSQLDSVTGDGDHGISISKGFLNTTIILVLKINLSLNNL